MTQMKVEPGGTYQWTRDATANDSDKTFTVPAGKKWLLLDIVAEITATATVGNRSLRVDVGNGVAVLWVAVATGSIAATQVGTMYCEQGFGAANTSIRLGPSVTSTSVSASQNMPPMMLLPGYTIRVLDRNAVDAAADDLIVVLHYIEYDA